MIDAEFELRYEFSFKQRVNENVNKGKEGGGSKQMIGTWFKVNFGVGLIITE